MARGGTSAAAATVKHLRSLVRSVGQESRANVVRETVPLLAGTPRPFGSLSTRWVATRRGRARDRLRSGPWPWWGRRLSR